MLLKIILKQLPRFMRCLSKILVTYIILYLLTLSLSLRLSTNLSLKKCNEIILNCKKKLFKKYLKSFYYLSVPKPPFLLIIKYMISSKAFLIRS